MGRKVQAIVLAGGFGTRLFPLTDAKPKPLVKIVDKTVLDTVIEAIEKTETDTVTLSTCHFSDMIEAECGKHKRKIMCVKETTPLGTAGGVKNCAKDGFDAYLVVSGDGVFDFDLQKAIDLHFDKEPYVTIVCTNKSDPTEYGTIRCDKDGKIYDIEEKPAWKNVKTSLVNTGIYVLSPKAVEMIPDGEMYDFSKQLFKLMLSKNLAMYAVTLDGYWCDIGTLEEYKNCCKTAIMQKCRSELFKNIRNTSKEGFEITPDSYVHKNTVVGKNAGIKDESVVCKNVSIGENCEICDSIISEDSVIGKGSGIYGAIVGENVTCGEDCIIPEGCVLGDGCVVKDWSVLKKGTLVRSMAVVYREDCENMGKFDIKNLFVDDGVLLLGGNNSLEKVAMTASSLAVCFTKKDKRPSRICVGCDKEARAYKSAFVTGALTRGSVVTELERSDENILTFCSYFLPFDVFVYIKTNDNDTIKLYILEKHARALCDENERKIIKNLEKISGELQTGLQEKLQTSQYSAEVNAVDVLPLYFSFLEEFCEDIGLDRDVTKPKISLLEDKKQASESSGIFKRLLERFGFDFYYGVDNALKLSFSQICDECCIRYKNTAIDKNHIEAVVLNNLDCLNIKKTRTSKNIPFALRNLVKNDDAYENNPRMAELFENDSIVLLLSFLGVCTKRGESMEKLLQEIPGFEVYSDELFCDIDRAGTMHKLACLYKTSDGYSGDGINLTLSNGNVTIIPSRAKGFKIISEAVNMETAKEICLDIEKIIKEKADA